MLNLTVLFHTVLNTEVGMFFGFTAYTNPLSNDIYVCPGVLTYTWLRAWNIVIINFYAKTGVNS